MGKVIRLEWNPHDGILVAFKTEQTDTVRDAESLAFAFDFLHCFKTLPAMRALDIVTSSNMSQSSFLSLQSRLPQVFHYPNVKLTNRIPDTI